MATTPFDAGRSSAIRAQAPGGQDAQEAKAERMRKSKAAMAWLQAYLHGQPMAASQIEAEAARLGIAHTTLQTAKERLHIRSERSGKGWAWVPPQPAKRRRKQPVS